MKKRLISLLLVICMVLTLLPAEVLAAEVKKPADNASQTAVVQENPFTDVEKNSWYAAAVQYVRVNGFFSGVSDTLFAPDGSMTRGMFVTVLGRMAGVDAAKYGGETGFSDVEPTAWYAPYVKWAAQYGIANGMGNGLFAPNDKINREQMAVFFAAYFEKFDVTPKTEKAIAGKPADLGQVSDWAKSAVLKLWSMGLLCGDGVNFTPKDTATRAEAATLCKSVDKSVETWYSEPGVESTRVSVDPEQQEPKPTPTPTPSGPSVTSTNYLVQFEMGKDQPTMTLPNKGEYASGTPITQLPTPVAQGMIFLGWFYDKELKRGVEIGDTVTKSMTLYAKAAAGSEVTPVETPNYVTKDEVPAGNFSFDVIGVNKITDETIKFINITETDSPVTYTVSGTTVTAELKAGQTYQVELLDENARLKVDGAEQPATVRYLNIRTQKKEVTNAGLNSDVKEIPAEQTGNLAEDVFNGIYQIDPNGTTTRNTTSGTFTYSGGDALKVGDVLAVTDHGASLKDVKSETGDVAYITYDLGGHGTNGDNPATYTIESDTFTLADPTPNTGYTFVGWYDAAEGGNQITNIQKGSYGDRTVYARWSTSGFNIIYADVNATNATNFDALPKSFTIGGAVSLVDAKMSNDSVFLYWCTDLKNPEKTKITEIPKGTNASVTLYAHCITTQIKKLSDLTALRDAVNAGYSMAGETFQLVNAIDLPSDWKSIGRNYTDTTGTEFAGTFDGGTGGDPNVAITYPACGNNVMETVQPLFGVNAGTVQNLVVKLQATVNNWDADMPFGMVAQANATGGKITNCKVIAAADVTEVAVSKREYAGSAVAGSIGGIVGVNDGTITDCSVGNAEAVIRIKGNSSTDQSLGGIAAVNNGTISLANSCINVIPEQSATYAGGLVGKNTGSVILGANVELMGTGNSAWTAPFTYYGGLVGLSTGNITLNEIPTMSVDEKIATTKTETEYFAGGLVGKLEDCSLTVNSDAQAKELLVELYQDSYNPQKNTLYSGGLVGQAVNATVDGGGKLTIKGVTDIYRNNICSQSYAGALAGKSDAASTFQNITLEEVRVTSSTGESYLFGSGEGQSENITVGANCKWNDKAVNGT